ncbi:MAG: hypothetical protein MO847_00255 [Candidatus Protistobacter heckmanni]|nr:hypothetical protein [Candidatus Protistobacter heckmanni]
MGPAAGAGAVRHAPGEDGIPAKESLVWTYRFRDQGTWNTQAHLHFGPDGHVKRLEILADPAFEFRFWRMR